MSENLRKLLEAASADPAFAERLTAAATPEALLALAREKDVLLSEEDLNALAQAAAPKNGELTDDELEAVAGGQNCYCPIIGGGVGDDEGNKTCVCIAGGIGMQDGNSEKGIKYGDRCFCPIAGEGRDGEDHYISERFGIKSYGVE
jgi:predicted ribosomally synthesized peptide with nif11-like leader